MEAPGSLGSPLRKWSKVTSGMVLGDQEAPDRWVGRQGFSSWVKIQQLRLEEGKTALPLTVWLRGAILFGTPVLAEKRRHWVLLR